MERMGWARACLRVWCESDFVLLRAIFLPCPYDSEGYYQYYAIEGSSLEF